MRKPFIVAEMSANHLGSMSRALDLVKAAAQAGADAIKVQAWDPAHMVVDLDATVSGGPWDGRKLSELYSQCWMPFEWIPGIFDAAKDHGILGFASVFDEVALGVLERIGCPIYKIASCEIVDIPLIRAVARTGKPMMISTGMASEREIHAAVDAAIDAENFEITLLKCTSAYPASFDEANLATMVNMRGRYCLKVGLSDHTLGNTVAVVATALGADVIEKHITLRRADGGPDAGFSSEPEEFADMVMACTRAHSAVGHVYYGCSAQELPTLALRRSLHYAKALPQDHTIAPGDIVSARPAGGLPPVEIERIAGRRLKHSVHAGEITQWEDFHV